MSTSSSCLRLAVICDIHYGLSLGTKCGSRAKELFERFTKAVNSSGAALCIDLGDRISDVDRETDFELLREVSSWFENVNAPRVHLVGNHDVAVLTVEEQAELLSQPLQSRSQIVGNIRLIFWLASAKLDPTTGLMADPEDLLWLQSELAQSQLPTFIFTHVPLDGGSFTGIF